MIADDLYLKLCPPGKTCTLKLPSGFDRKIWIGGYAGARGLQPVATIKDRAHTLKTSALESAPRLLKESLEPVWRIIRHASLWKGENDLSKLMRLFPTRSTPDLRDGPVQRVWRWGRYRK